MGVFTVILPVVMELAVPRLVQYVVDAGIRAGAMAAIVRGAGAMLAAALIGSIATVGQGFCRALLSQGLAFDIRNALFAHIQSLSFANLDALRTGGLMTRLSSDVDIVRMFSSGGLALFLRALLMLLGSMVMIMLIDWQLSLLVWGLLLISAVIIWSFMQVASPLFAVVQRKLSALNTAVQENLAGVEVIKAFVRESFEIDRFQEHNAAYMDQHIKVGRLLALVTPTLTVLSNVGMFAILWWGGQAVIGDRLTVGELIAFNSYLMIGMAPLLMLGNIMTMASRADASAARVLELFETEPDIAPVVASPDAPLTGAVQFEGVSFRYHEALPDDADSGNGSGNPAPAKPGNGNGDPANGNGRVDVLEDVSFTAEPGQVIALLGATGSGKTTLVNLITRFYDVTGGRVMLDGVAARDWSQEALAAQIGMVMQQPLLFSGTVRENIAYGRPDATLDDVVAAAQAAQAHDFIMAMPEGYGSVVESRGANLSGGQKQRIAIARALLIAPRILILDDSTSAVDLETEIKIQEALAALPHQPTTFIVAQRISSVLTADKIIVLDGGHVAAQGTHRELLQSSPIYRDICLSQFGEDSALLEN